MELGRIKFWTGMRDIWPAWRSAGCGLGDVLLPRRCHFCGRFLSAASSDSFICRSCQKDLKRPGRPACLVCGEPFRSQAGPDRICGSCWAKPPPFRAARFAVAYEDPVAEAVRRFKYNSRVELSRSLGRLLADYAFNPPLPDRFDLILPVPLHPGRLKKRGFNQAVVLAHHLKHRGPVRSDLLRRTRATRPQVGLDAKARLANVKGAFVLTDPGAVRGRTVLLVDDVWTTGATARECARTLGRAKPAAVYVLTLCRLMGL